MKLLIFVLCVPIITYSQSANFQYQKKSFKLDSLLSIVKDTSSYIKEYESLEVDSLLEKDIFMACRIYAKRRQYEKFQINAKKSMEAGQITEPFLNFNTHLPEKEKKELFNIEMDMKKLYFSKIPKNLYDEIKELVIVDSKIRNLNIYKKIDYSVVKIIDSVTLLKLHQLIEKYGMITERKHGALFNDFFYLIIHCTLYKFTDYEWMRKMLYKSVMNGDSDTNLYAYFVDRWEVLNKGEQLYGSFTNNTPIQDLKNVDIRRKAIGACSLWQWKIIRKGRM
jgi:hypothetical protein